MEESISFFYVINNALISSNDLPDVCDINMFSIHVCIIQHLYSCFLTSGTHLTIPIQNKTDKPP